MNLPIGLAALIPARRTLVGARDPDRGAMPDLVGVALLAFGVGLVALGIVQGPEWGWGGADVIGALAGGVLLLAAGFALTPGPLMAATFAPIGGRISDARGQRVVAIPGTLLFAAGIALTALLTDGTPDHVTEFLPGSVIAGVGVGLTFAALGSAAVAELPPARFATGSAVSATARQIGAVLGISVLIAVLGTPAPGEAVGAFHSVWALMAVLGVLAAAVSRGLSRGQVRAGVSSAGVVEPSPA